MEQELKQKLKQKLEQELAKLELELTDIGHINSADHIDWTGVSDVPTETEDKNILADKVEEEQTNNAIVDELEVRRLAVKNALEKMKNGGYGICEVCGKEIEEERLLVNPAASTCIEHAD